MTVSSTVRPAPPLAETVATLAAVALIYAFHCLFGALQAEAAILLAALEALMLLILLGIPAIRRELAAAPALSWIAIPFLLTVVVAIASLSPAPAGDFPGLFKLAAASRVVDRAATEQEIVKLLGLGCAFLVGAALARSDQRTMLALRWTVYAGAAFGLVSLLLSVSGYAYQSQPGRLEAGFLNPNTAGAVFGVLFILALGMALSSRRKGQANPNGSGVAHLMTGVIAMLVLAACLLATGSRGAFISTGVAALILLLSRLFERRPQGHGRIAMLALAGCAVASLLVIPYGERVFGRMAELGKDAEVRELVWRVHGAAQAREPMTGYGLGGFDTVNRVLIDPVTFRNLWNMRAALNLYLQWFEEAGLFGAVPMFAAIAAVVLFTLRGVWRRRSMRVWLMTLLAVDVLLLVHGSVDFGLQTYSVAIFWSFLLGLQYACAGVEYAKLRSSKSPNVTGS